MHDFKGNHIFEFLIYLKSSDLILDFLSLFGKK